MFALLENSGVIWFNTTNSPYVYVLIYPASRTTPIKLSRNVSKTFQASKFNSTIQADRRMLRPCFGFRPAVLKFYGWKIIIIIKLDCKCMSELTITKLKIKCLRVIFLQ